MTPQPPHPLTLRVLKERFGVCRLAADSDIPEWAFSPGSLTSITRTVNELSIVCSDERIPEGVTVERAWRAFRVEGPLSFDLVGILADLSAALAAAGVPLFSLSTYDTDYLLVPEGRLSLAVAALEQAGHRVQLPA